MARHALNRDDSDVSMEEDHEEEVDDESRFLRFFSQLYYKYNDNSHI